MDPVHARDLSVRTAGRLAARSVPVPILMVTEGRPRHGIARPELPALVDFGIAACLTSFDPLSCGYDSDTKNVRPSGSVRGTSCGTMAIVSRDASQVCPAVL
jgi:hypothetical protein